MDQTATYESACRTTANGMDIYKSFWVFVIGSVFGFIVETIWCFFVHEHLEWHSSLVCLPLSAIYGCGALALHAGSRIIGNKKPSQIFVYGAVSCTIVEYICSLAQEMAFGTVSWDYSNAFLNIDGRVCLLMTVFWGALAVVWVWAIDPLFDRLINRIPKRVYKPLTWATAILILIFTTVSVFAITRWSMRLDGIPPVDAVASLLDKFFPDATMRVFYPKMTFL